MNRDIPLTIPLNISIVVANFNNESFLGDFFLSIIKSKVAIKELLFVDDGSYDNSLNIVYSFKEQIPFLKVIPLRKNKGLPTALNIGIDQALGKYIMRIDPDDFISPLRIVTQYSLLQQNPQIDIVGSNVYYYNHFLKKVIFRSSFPEDFPAIYKLYKLGHHGVSHNSIMGKTEIFKKYKYDAKAFPAEDYEIFSRMITNNVTLQNISTPLTYYRIHNKNISLLKINEIFQKVSFYQKYYFGKKSSKLYLKRKTIHFKYFRKALIAKNKLGRYFLFFISSLFFPSKFLKRVFY